MDIRIIESADSRLLAELNHDVQELHAQIEPKLFKKHSVSEMEKLFVELLESKNMHSYVAYYGDEPAGYIVISESEYPESCFKYSYKVIYIHQICVASKYRGKNIGKELVEKAKLYAEEKGISRIELDFWYKNENSGQFFRTQGFMTFNEKMFINV